MTGVLEAPEESLAAELDKTQRRVHILSAIVAVLAIALVGLGVWVVYEATTGPETAVNAEIQQLLDDYAAAWNNYDGDGFLAVVGDDYVMRTGRYGDWTADQQVVPVGDSITHGWHSEVIGEAIMTGEGPWYVSHVQYLTTTDSLLPPEGVYGVSTFKIVDEDGTLKIARHTFSADFYE